MFFVFGGCKNHFKVSHREGKKVRKRMFAKEEDQEASGKITQMESLQIPAQLDAKSQSNEPSKKRCEAT